MKKYVLVGMITLGIVYSCATNPITGKKTLNFVPNNQLFPTAFQQYDTFLKENKVISGTADAKKVEAIGFRIKAAAEKYLNYLGQGQYLVDYRWEYKLVDNKEVNAWCLPGGKIVVYSGILPITKDDAGLATVMGHEVSHALADHGAQRMSAGQAQEVLGQVIAVGTSGKSERTQQIIGQAYGLSSQFGVMLPFSRSHETEADKIGLVLMAIAGYNPETSIAFWQRMSAQSNGQAPPEFMSTHPSDATRIANLQAYIPEAKAIAAKVGVIK
ncbi:Beta-barrel assembly-enhancing protease [Flavobacterium sp. CECT 9288]|uniref:M48 family metallopeptidase n=1 Tax=Flavobacterium sp. CECT 9288 TaxID=2845819 RepID=UPI001E31FFBD|nr:M48 family metallopeptidase [Flavobacterium sp. CECT 9288]CAH0335947.1 Beta-barrel assembly-enhancing protease [Flavobacterium sp. CECT 9288]